ncbi:MAG: HAD family hydrolase [Chlamydiales bacterium]
MQISVFDLDHTLLKVNSSYQFGLYLYRNKILSAASLLLCLSHYACHKWFGLSLEKLHGHVFNAFFRGRSLCEIQQWAHDFIQRELDLLIYAPAIQRLHLARQQGDYTVILSSSPDFLVGPIAHHFEVSDWRATQYTEDSEGKLASLSHIVEGKDKARYVKALANRLGIALSSVTVYSDSYLDLPVLEIAGKAVGVSPDKSLKKVCQANEWEIL